MKKEKRSAGGVALVCGSILLLVTMAFHPQGESLEHLRNISTTIIVTHGIAIISVPILLYGFWEFHIFLGEGLFLSRIAFVTVAISLLSMMMAGVLNGLVLPIFLNGFGKITQDIIEPVTYIIKYNTAANHAFDYLYISLYSCAMLLFCASIIRGRKLKIWSAVIGFVIVAFVIAITFIHDQILSLHTFRLLVLGFIAWTSLIGIMMFRIRITEKTLR